MRKTIAVLLCLMMLLSAGAGCAAQEPAVLIPDETPASGTGPSQDATPSPEPAPAETEVPAGPAATPAPTMKASSNFEFQPKVCSSYMREIYGDVMCDTWFELVDAVLAGEDRFPCPDKETYDWVMGQFPNRFFPIIRELIDFPYDRSHPVVDGMGIFEYKIPRDEVPLRIKEFESQVRGILNSVLKDDYSDLEKALALYLYFGKTYTYDYEAAKDPNARYICSYRVFSEGTGICHEFAIAYAYLLLQVGVDATTVLGTHPYPDQGHEWSYVKINGHNFHVDPTYVISSPGTLAHFMMTDERREEDDDYVKEKFIICSHRSQDVPHPDYKADDDTFSELWTGTFVSLDHDGRAILYESQEEASGTVRRFDFTGW